MWQPSQQQQIAPRSELTFSRNKSCQVQQLNESEIYTVYMFQESMTSGPCAEQRHSFFGLLKNFSSHLILTTSSKITQKGVTSYYSAPKTLSRSTSEKENLGEFEKKLKNTKVSSLFWPGSYVARRHFS